MSASSSSNPDEIILGIDLGTTHSLVAISENSKPRILKDGDSSLIPSVISFDSEGRVQTVGQRAKTLKSLDPKHLLYSVKRLMGKGRRDLEFIHLPFDFSPSTEEMIRIRMGKRIYTPIELSAEILKRCQFVAENALGRPLTKAVITVPAYFNDGQRSATAVAGRLAGLEVVRIINEPTAAALAFGLGKSEKQELIAVYDLGGGTFDISILKVTSGVFEVLATHGDTNLGGDDFDQALYGWMVKKMGKAPSSDADKALLMSQLESAKKVLSIETETSVILHWANEIQWTGKVRRSDIENLFKPLIERSLEACRRALIDAGLRANEMAHIVLVGGATRVPLVQEMVGTFFEKTPDTSLNPDEVVALGAAIQGAILAGKMKKTLLLDVVPLSLGIETMGGVVTKLIPRNSTIPATASEYFTTSADNQTGVDIHVLQGERDLVADCRSLGQIQLQIPPSPAGIPKIEVTFMMDANGILKVRALDMKTKELAELEVKPSFGLSDNEVERMLADAWKNAERDIHQRVLIEARNQAEATIRATEKALQSPLLDKSFKIQQRTKLDPILKALREDMKGAISDIIVVRTKELDLAAIDLADAIMTNSLKESFKPT